MVKKAAVKKMVSAAKSAAKKTVQEKVKEFEAKPEVRVVEPLDPEFVVEWMAENDMRHGDDWNVLRPGYQREYCEVRTKDGVEVGPCFPDKGVFTRLDGAQMIMESDVTHVRYFERRDIDEEDEYEDDE